MIFYTNKLETLSPDMLAGFFAGWKEHPSTETLLQILKNSEHKILAMDNESNKIAGFIYAITDNLLCAYIPLLEVLPEYQHKGIGGELVRRMLNELKEYYMIDLICDDNLVNFYSNNGMTKHTAMIKRNYDHQGGKESLPNK